MEIHVVRPGETLYSIAQFYKVDETILGQANGVPPGAPLAVGQTLVIQHPQTLHIVQPGQNLFGIARLYGLTLRQLYLRRHLQLAGAAQRAVLPQGAQAVGQLQGVDDFLPVPLLDR